MKKRFTVSAGAVLLLSALYFFGDFSTLSAVMLAAAVHESGHIAAIKMFKGKIKRLNFDASGFCMNYCGLDSEIKELTAILMGPIFGIAFAFAASHFGNRFNSAFLCETAGVSMIFSVFNLLPALPLDGGRALYCVIPSRSRAKRVLDNSGMLTGIALIFVGLYFLGRELGAAFLLAGVWVLIAQTGIVKTFRMM